MSKSKGVLEIISPRHSNDDLQDLRDKVHKINEQCSEPHLLPNYEMMRNLRQNTPQDSSIQLLEMVQSRNPANLEE